MKDHYWKQKLTFSPFHSLCISRVTLNTKSHKMQKDAKQRLRYKKQYKYCRLPTDMWKVLWAAVLCCSVLSKWRSINEVTAYQKQYFSEFMVKFSVWKLEWCLCAGVTVGVVVVFCRQIHEKTKTGHLWDAPRFKAQRPSWSSLLRCLCCGRVIWHRALNKWWHTQSRLKCGVWENLFLLNMKRWACLHQKLFTWRSTHSRRFSESELLFWEFWPLSLIIYILYSQEISKFDPDVRCLCVSEFLLLPNKKPLIASSKSWETFHQKHIIHVVHPSVAVMLHKPPSPPPGSDSNCTNTVSTFFFFPFWVPGTPPTHCSEKYFKGWVTVAIIRPHHFIHSFKNSILDS